MNVPSHTLWTIGHSTRPIDVFLSMLQEAGIAVLADVRRFAGSRRNPQFSRDTLPKALRGAGIDYLPMPALGGRRKPDPDSPNTAWRVEAFRAYADHLASAEYVGARDSLMRIAASRRSCVMCAEAVWWRCHRADRRRFHRARMAGHPPDGAGQDRTACAQCRCGAGR